jgi:enoyl-CoA hydratase/carnithine racemase
MKLKFLSALALLAAPIAAVNNSTSNATAPITTTKVTPAYWRATFSNPPFNLETNEWFESFFGLVDDIENDPDVKVVVFDSSAPDFWMAHFDTLNPVNETYISGFFPKLIRLSNLPVLTIAAVRGIARGGGAELVASLDVAFASRERALFGQFEVASGGLPAGGGMSFLPRTVGRARALEIVLGADDFDADTAALYGWINRAIPDAEFPTFVDTFARRVASFDKLALSEAKRLINKHSSYPTAEEQKEEWDAFLVTAADPNVQARMVKLAELGLQTDVEFEKNIAERIMAVTGQGPWDV